MIWLKSSHADHLNAPRLIADQNQQTVWRWDQAEPFGNNPADENPSGLGTFDLPLRLPGQYFDKETNLHYNYFRDYDPGTGRYVQPDPIGTVLFQQVALAALGAVGVAQPELSVLVFSKRPQYNHLYAYVGSGPLIYNDPLGLLGLVDCYECFTCQDEFEDALKICRDEYDRCKTLKDQIDFIEKYGGGFASTAIYNCATKKNPDAFTCMIEQCGACGVNPKGPWPSKRR